MLLHVYICTLESVVLLHWFQSTYYFICSPGLKVLSSIFVQNSRWGTFINFRPKVQVRYVYHFSSKSPGDVRSSISVQKSRWCMFINIRPKVQVMYVHLFPSKSLGEVRSLISLQKSRWGIFIYIRQKSRWCMFINIRQKSRWGMFINICSSHHHCHLCTTVFHILIFFSVIVRPICSKLYRNVTYLVSNSIYEICFHGKFTAKTIILSDWLKFELSSQKRHL